MNRAVIVAVVLLAVLGIGGIAYFMFDDSGTKSKEPVEIGGGGKAAEVRRPDVSPTPIATQETNPPAPKISSRSLAESGGMLSDAGVMGVVQNEAGARIEGALCELYEDGSMLKDRSQEGELRSKQSTTLEGLFLFDRNVLSLAERYLLKVSHPMYVTERRAVDIRRDAGVLTVVMKAGTAISGVVRTVGGVGLPNATVTVFDLTQNALDPNGSVETYAVTDGTGAYSVMHVAPGMKKIQASAQGFATSGRQGVNVESGRPQQNMDFTLNEGGGISGQVMSSEGQPVAGAYVTARPVRVGPRPDADATAAAQAHEIQARREGDVKRRERAARVAEAAHEGADEESSPERTAEMKELIAQKEAQMAKEREAQKDPVAARRAAGAHQPPSALTTLSVRTNADGTFAIAGTEIGSYVVSVNASGFMPPAQQSVETPAQGVLFTVQPNARILGRVVDDVTGRPIVMFSVGLTTNPDEVLVPAYSKKSFGPPKSSDGSFEYVDVRPGKFWLVADAAGYAGGRSQEIVIQQGERREGVEIRLVKGATIKGRVVDAKGGVADAVVTPDPASLTGNQANPFIGVLTASMRRDVKEVRTDREGRFEIPNMLSGSYTLSVRHPDYGPQTTPVFTVGTSGEVSHPDIVMSRGASIRGRVKLPDGAADPKAMVQVTPIGGAMSFGGHRTAYTGADGSFEVNGLAVGQYRVVVAQRNGTPDLSSLFKGLAQQGGQVQNLITLGEGEVKDVGDL